MDDIEFEDCWKEPHAALRGNLVWVDPDPKLGLQTHIAMVSGRQGATIRKVSNTQERIVSVPGWVWRRPVAGSAAAKLGIGETEVKGFIDLRSAKRAVEYAFKCLPCTTDDNRENPAPPGAPNRPVPASRKSRWQMIR